MTLDDATARKRTAEPIAMNATLFAALFQQNWENVRNIKSERFWFLNAHAITSIGALSIAQSISGDFVLRSLLMLSMCFFSLVGLVTSLRLKAELEECLETIQTMVAHARVGEFVALAQLEGKRSRYPAFRWAFPALYSFAAVMFFGLFVYRLVRG